MKENPTMIILLTLVVLMMIANFVHASTFSVTNLSNNNTTDCEPSVDNGNIAWKGWNENQWERPQPV